MIIIKTKNGNSDENSIDLIIRHGDAATQERSPTEEDKCKISFNQRAIKSYGLEGWKPIHHDLLVLAAAVECADKRVVRPSGWSRTFRVTLPVSQLDIWRDCKIQSLLYDALDQITGDSWHFEFLKDENPHDFVRQEQFSLPNKDSLKRVMPYSDGLDSWCVSNFYETKETARVRIAGKRGGTNHGMEPFELIRFNSTPTYSAESSGRSRAFKFAVVTAIASHLANTRTVIVPESGQGALAPVLTVLNGAYPDYRNHPVFFSKMARFIMEVLEHPVRYEQPQLWMTKAHAVITYLDQHKDQAAREIAKMHICKSRSCWQQRRNVQIHGKRRQCGLCAACMLRRLSLFISGVDESDGTYTFTRLGEKHYESALVHGYTVGSGNISNTMGQHGFAAVQHLQQFADIARKPDHQLRGRARQIAECTGGSEHDTIGKIRVLAEEHSEDWHRFLNQFGEKSFVRRWAAG